MRVGGQVQGFAVGFRVQGVGCKVNGLGVMGEGLNAEVYGFGLPDGDASVAKMDRD